MDEIEPVEYSQTVSIPDVDPRDDEVARALRVGGEYHDYQIERTGKVPLRFRGLLIAESGFSDDEKPVQWNEYAIRVYKTVGANYVVVISEILGENWHPYVSTLTANSLQELGDKLRKDKPPSGGWNVVYSGVVDHVLHQLFPDDPDYIERID
jgi:hypothetical protein